jgi:hypothetical protein
MTTKKSNIPLRFIDKGATTIQKLAFYGAICYIAYQIRLSVVSLAGYDTSVAVSYMTETGCGITITVSISFGLLGMIYGYRRHKLYRDAIKTLAPRVAEYEKLIDPKRTSSGLRTDGTTNPKDD